VAERAPAGAARPKKRGRPRAAAPGAALTTWVDPALHDAIIAIARRRAISVSAVVRALLRFRVGRG